jgi:uncharacterized SAM-binding protein YcdF (DUF218 family)
MFAAGRTEYISWTDACVVPGIGALLLVVSISLAYFFKPWGAISFIFFGLYLVLWKQRIDAQRAAHRLWERPLEASAVVVPGGGAPTLTAEPVARAAVNSNSWQASQQRAMDKL